MGIVGRIGVGLLSAQVVGTQLFLEAPQCVFVVRQQLLVGDLVGIVGDGALVAGAHKVAVDGGDHVLIGHFIGGRGLLLGGEQVHQLHDTGLGTVGSLGGDQIIAVGGAGAHGLGTVLVQTDNVGGVQGVGTGIHRVQVHIEVKQHVFHSQRVTVGVLDAVLQNEGVGHGAIAVFHDVVVLGGNGFVLAVGDLHFTVAEGGAQQTDLGQAYDGAVVGGSIEEGIEQAVQLLGHNDEGISAGLAAAGKHGDHADAQSKAQDQGKDSFHCILAPLLIRVFYCVTNSTETVLSVTVMTTFSGVSPVAWQVMPE